jgi:hypothetical protein
MQKSNTCIGGGSILVELGNPTLEEAAENPGSLNIFS